MKDLTSSSLGKLTGFLHSIAILDVFIGQSYFVASQNTICCEVKVIRPTRTS